METLITYLIETILWNRPLIVMMIFHIFFYGVGISVFSGGSQFLVIGHKCIFCPSQLRANSGIPRLLVNLLACGTLSRLIFNNFFCQFGILMAIWPRSFKAGIQIWQMALSWQNYLAIFFFFILTWGIRVEWGTFLKTSDWNLSFCKGRDVQSNFFCKIYFFVKGA